MTYKLFKTVKKTAKENGLLISKDWNCNTILFDFALLDTLEISDREKQLVKSSALKNVCVSNKDDFYGADFDNFTRCNGITNYISNNVYNKHGKRLYTIMQLTRIKHNSFNRDCIYDSFKVASLETSLQGNVYNCNYEI